MCHTQPQPKPIRNHNHYDRAASEWENGGPVGILLVRSPPPVSLAYLPSHKNRHTMIQSARNKNNNSPAADVIAEGDPISAVSVQAGEEEPRLGRIPVARVVPAAAAGGLLSCLLAAFGHLADCEIVSE